MPASAARRPTARRARLPRALELHKPAIVILELGGNDGLRGLPVRQVRANFEFLIDESQAAGAQVLLVGMRMPPNYGAAMRTRSMHSTATWRAATARRWWILPKGSRSTRS